MRDDLDPSLWNTYSREQFSDGGIWLHQVRCRDGVWSRRVLSEHPCGTGRVVLNPVEIGEKEGWRHFDAVYRQIGAET